MFLSLVQPIPVDIGILPMRKIEPLLKSCIPDSMNTQNGIDACFPQLDDILKRKYRILPATTLAV